MKNAVLALRAKQLETSKREFNARGGKMIRCDHCLLAVNYCICAGIEVAMQCQSAVCMLMSHNESYKPSNTGRLIADIIPDHYAFRWQRTEVEPELLALLANPAYQGIIVFPQDNLPAERFITSVPRELGKKPLFIFLDGTWREAKRMIRKSPYLDNLPIISITPDKLSEYKLRVAAFDNHLGTAEVAILVLELAGEHDAATKLEKHFIDFREAYLAGKRNKGELLRGSSSEDE